MAELNFMKINSRIALRIDTEGEWNKVGNEMIPLKGELIIYSTDELYSFQRFKVGDGQTELNKLPFILHNPVWAGTAEQYAAISDQLAVGTIVCITEGEDTPSADGATTAKLGCAKLGYAKLGQMILGQD